MTEQQSSKSKKARMPPKKKYDEADVLRLHVRHLEQRMQVLERMLEHALCHGSGAKGAPGEPIAASAPVATPVATPVAPLAQPLTHDAAFVQAVATAAAQIAANQIAAAQPQPPQQRGGATACPTDKPADSAVNTLAPGGAMRIRSVLG